jgi:hypothetical protein
MNEKDITKLDVERYEMVRQGGRTNMFDVRNVQALSGLSRDKIMYIMKNYSALIKKYNISRG